MVKQRSAGRRSEVALIPSPMLTLALPCAARAARAGFQRSSFIADMICTEVFPFPDYVRLTRTPSLNGARVDRAMNIDHGSRSVSPYPPA
ncbi:uncharacterized protein BO80DRAFT_249499 [Aspergillus ibericus CBS 121593]|uniref:Uncharacterized protein n=1 Tax=Aspergillus ibericus CBS 121593 TaxID=1448316 RepID=A0A395GNW8_9EURO|nr:hypothetical protein BO80DRAFT_249499 [Aspergillus ibericus CBS 121593]RAK95713.1 hypothetical protein BO80DRAFT_249499 [Aspergillus ibericus CBS 121593]